MQVTTSRVYRPPVAGEPIRLREDGHRILDDLLLYLPGGEGRGTALRSLSRSPLQQDQAAYSETGRWGAVGATVGPWVSNGGIFEPVRFSPVVVLPAGSDYTFTVAANLTGHVGPNPGFWREEKNFNILQDSEQGRPWIRIQKENVLYPAEGETAERGYHVYSYVVRSGQWVGWYKDGVLYHEQNHAVTTGRSSIGALGRNLDGDYIIGALGPVSWHTRALAGAEIEKYHAAPDLPIWRERSGVSMAGLAVPNELTITDRIGVGDSVDIVRPVAVIDSLAVADEIANLKHLMTLADAVQIDEMTRAGSPCHGGYFERPSGTCQSGYQEDDDQDSNLYQEMV